MTSGGPSNGAVQHVSTWLNGRGWETEWRAAEAPEALAERRREAGIKAMIDSEAERRANGTRR